MHPAASCMVSGLFGRQMVRPCHRLSVCLSGTRVYCGQTGCTIELSFWHTPYHGNNNDVLGECPTVQIPSGAGLQAAKVWSEVSPNWPKICLVLTCNISETLHDMEYVIYMKLLTLYRLARSPLKGQISLSSCYCALHFSIVPWAPRKSEGAQ